jgi:hypothetical protein
MTQSTAMPKQDQACGRIACVSKLSSVGYGAPCPRDQYSGSDQSEFSIAAGHRAVTAHKGFPYTNLFGAAWIKHEGSDGASSNATPVHERAGPEKARNKKEG